MLRIEKKDERVYRGDLQEVGTELDVKVAFEDCVQEVSIVKEVKEVLKAVYEKSTCRCTLKKLLEIVYKKYACWKLEKDEESYENGLQKVCIENDVEEASGYCVE